MDTGAAVGEAALSDLAWDYHRRRVTWERLAPVAAAVGLRVAIGRWRRADAVAAALALAVYGPAEWVGHHAILHGLRLGPFVGRRDGAVYESHLAHHRAPDDLDLLFVRVDAVPKIVVAGALGTVLVARRTTAPLTAMATLMSLMAGYHWVHYLMHAPYEGRGRWYRRLEANHQLHHDQASESWRMGVLFMTADRALERAGVRPGSATRS